jgi:neutral ceramidase
MNPQNDFPWNFGAATVDITPIEPILLGGYIRDEPSASVRNPIHAKMAFFQSADGTKALIINADIVGFSRTQAEYIAREAQVRYGIAREHIILSATHNHSGPAIDGVLPLFHPFTIETKAAVYRYAQKLLQQIFEGIDEAVANAHPCRLGYHTGLAGFAVNRRRAASHLRHLPTVVDHDVPVLVATNAQGVIRGILFGYACHTTVMFDNSIDGDYSGYAQTELEAEHPECTAIFLAGCGGDSNPLPRRKVTLAQTYGHLLSTAVQDAIAGEGTDLVHSQIVGIFNEIELLLEPAPSIESIQAELDPAALRRKVMNEQFRPIPPEWSSQETENQIVRSVEGARRKLHYQLECDQLGTRATSISYPIQVLQFGGILSLVGLAGEPVADYALRIKEKHGFLNTWPLGYCNELVGYIPSLRILQEGGYEGKTSMAEYGWPSPFCLDVEERILQEVADQMAAAQPSKSSPEPLSREGSTLLMPEN